MQMPVKLTGKHSSPHRGIQTGEKEATKKDEEMGRRRKQEKTKNQRTSLTR